MVEALPSGALLKNNEKFTFFTKRSKRASACHDLCLVHFEDPTFFSSSKEDARLLVMSADSHINNLNLCASSRAQSFFRFGMKVLSAYGDLHDLVDRLKGMDSVEPVSFDESLNFTLGNTETPMSEALTVLQLYLNDMLIFSYEANDERRL